MTPLLIITIVFCGIGFLLNLVIATQEEDETRAAFASNAFLLLMAIVAMSISLGVTS